MTVNKLNKELSNALKYENLFPAKPIEYSTSDNIFVHELDGLVKDNQLKDALDLCQEHMTELRKIIKQQADVGERQKFHFFQAVDDLMTKLKQSLVDRTSLLTLRNQEISQQELLFDELQARLNTLERESQQLETSSSKQCAKFGHLKNDLENATRVLSQISKLLDNEERKCGISMDRIGLTTKEDLVRRLQACFAYPRP